jgi:hypothetical protein
MDIISEEEERQLLSGGNQLKTHLPDDMHD